MKGKKITKVGSALLASLLTFSSLGVDVYANDVHVRSTSQSQMESEAETVYINNFSDSSVRRHLFNSNWKFNLGDARGAEAKIFDDAKWDLISVPHDYSIIQAYDKSLEAESGYLPGGIGWYRKYFTLGSDMEGKKIRLDFDGVYNNATVYVNGVEVGNHPYGYTPFSFDITDHLNVGEENVIAVKVDHKTPSSRWYSGSGIYRDVFLTVTNPVHVDLHGQKIEMPKMKDELNKEVTLKVKTAVSNETEQNANVKLSYKVYEKGNENEVVATFETADATAVNANSNATIESEFKTTKAPKLWDINQGNLYVLKTEVKNGETIVDTIEETIGFRHYEMDKNNGAFLNGKAIKLQGVCMHHDQGSLGSAAYHDAIRRQVKILKDMGVNSIRVTHNPSARALIDICNEEGILIIDEIFDGWMYAKNTNTNDFSVYFNKNIEADNGILGGNENMTWAEFEIKNALRRGQNDPSIIMWSLGNEIDEGAGGNGYDTKAQQLIKWAQEADSSRMLTIGSNRVKNPGNSEHHKIGTQLTNVGGASGANYADYGNYQDIHRRFPEWNLYGSETASSVNSRGVYTTKRNGSLDGNKQLTSYDKSKVGWGALASEAWYDVIRLDYVAGEYVWTGFDYIGEPTPANGTTSGAVGSWPSPKNSYFGIIDTAGFAKDSYYFYQSQWNKEVNTLHILPAWNQDAIMVDRSGNVEVVVYSDADKVELYVNDKKVGEQEFVTETTTQGHTYKHKKGENNSADDLFATFNVKYEAGTLSAKAYKLENGEYKLIENTQGRNSITTAGAAKKLVANTYGNVKEVEANNEDLIYVEVDVADEQGNFVPNATNQVTFKVEGEGVLVGVDNGSSPDHQSYKDDNRKAHAGKVLAIVKATNKAGEIKVTASAAGLEPAVVTVNSKAVGDQQPGEKVVSSVKLSRNLYVKVGSQPKLPEQVEVTYSDGKTELVNVTWDEHSGDVSNVGTFQVKGRTADGLIVTVNVNMISKVGALLNYSTTVPVGTDATNYKLPERRTAVLEDGQVLNASFEVVWDKIPADAFNEVGTVTVHGKANVFGEEKAVTASIRVQKESYTLTDDIQGHAILSQDIEEQYQSDTLEAIKNGSTARDSNTSGGRNPSLWSNYKNSQPANVPNENDRGNEDNTAELTFRYDTQQSMGQIEVYFASDSWSARYPKQDGITFTIDGAKLDTTVEVGPEQDGVKKYTYKFAPVKVTELKMQITNSDQAAANQAYRACTAITEVVIKKAQGSFTTNTTAALQSLTLNGNALTAAQLEKDSFNTPATVAHIENAVGKDNAAVTVLPAYNKQVKVIIESEDHKTTKVFTINLDTYAPDSEERDITLDASWITVPNEASGETKDKMLDNKANTKWHSDWSQAGRDKVAKLENRNIKVTFPEPKTVDGVRYMPRTDGPNGSIKQYRVEYKLADGTEWQVATEGAWDINHEWKVAKFDAIKNVKELRLVGVTTSADNGQDNQLLSAAEFRVTAPRETIDLSGFKLEHDASVTVPAIPEGGVTVPVVVTDADGKVLVNGADYVVKYENNNAFGTANIIVTGIVNYSGTIESTFEIVQSAVEINTVNYVSGSAKTTYTEGETLDPTGLKLNVVYSDQSEKEVAYNDAKDKFTFSPSLDTALTTDMTKVTVTYEGKEVTIDITVNQKAPVVPEVNKAELAALVEKAKGYDADVYTAESYRVLKDAIAAADAVLADSMTTQTVVDDAKAKLQAAIDGLEVIKVDYSKLEAVIKDADAIDTSKYTEESVNALKEALAAAKSVVANGGSQAQVDDAFNKLNAAIKDLVPNQPGEKVDTSSLEALVKKAKAIKADGYTVESYNALQEAIKAAEALLAKEELTQDQVKAMQTALQSAMDSLVKVAPSGSVNTGDSTNVMLFVGLAVVAIVGIVFVVKSKKKKD